MIRSPLSLRFRVSCKGGILRALALSLLFQSSFFPFSVHAQQCLLYEDHLRIVATVSTGAADVAVAGTYAYIAAGDSGLQVLDISNPLVPLLIGSVMTPGRALGVAVAEPYTYVSDGSSGLLVIDVSSQQFPTIVGSIDTPGHAVDVAVAGSYTYVADGSSGLQVVDISNPLRRCSLGALTPQTQL